MLDWFMEMLSNFGNTILSVLPHSPMQKFIGYFDTLPYLSYLNWFIPVSSIIIVCESWLAAIAIFYIYSIILRWVKAIGD